MEANEIRIGCNFQLENGVLGGGIATIKNKYDLDVAFDLLEANLIKPIPLTEEWLLKFGFTEKYKSTSNRWTKVCNGIVFQINDIENEDGELSGIFYYDFMLEIKYVHQLQNLYFALTGEELTFKLE